MRMSFVCCTDFHEILTVLYSLSAIYLQLKCAFQKYMVKANMLAGVDRMMSDIPGRGGPVAGRNYSFHR